MSSSPNREDWSESQGMIRSIVDQLIGKICEDEEPDMAAVSADESENQENQCFEPSNVVVMKESMQVAPCPEPSIKPATPHFTSYATITKRGLTEQIDSLESQIELLEKDKARLAEEHAAATKVRAELEALQSEAGQKEKEFHAIKVETDEVLESVLESKISAEEGYLQSLEENEALKQSIEKERLSNEEKIQRLREELAALKEANEGLQHTVNSQEMQMADIVNAKTEDSVKFEAVLSELQNYKGKCDMAEMALIDASCKRDELQKELASSRHELEVLSNDLVQRSKYIAELQNDTSVLEAADAIMESVVDSKISAEECYLQTMEQNEVLRQSLEQERIANKDKIGQLEDQLDALKVINVSLQSVISTQEAKVADVINAKAKDSEQLEAIQCELQRVKKSLDQANLELKDEVCKKDELEKALVESRQNAETLSHDLLQSGTAFDALKTQFTNLETEVEKSRNEKAALVEEMEVLKASAGLLESLQQDAKAARAQVSQLSVTIDNQAKEIASVRDEKLAMKSRLEEALILLKGTSVKFELTEKDLETANQELYVLDQKLKSQEKVIQAKMEAQLKDQAEATRTLEKKYEDLEQARDALATMKMNLEEKIEAVSFQANEYLLEKDELKQSRDQLQEQLDDANARLDHMKSENDRIAKAEQEAKTKIIDNEETILALNKALEESKAQIAKTTKSLEELESEKDTIVGQAKKVLEENSSLGNTIKEKLDIIEDQKNQLSVAEDEVKKQTDENEKLKADLQSQASAIGGHDADIAKLGEELKSKIEALEAAELKLSNIKTSCDELETAKMSLNMELEDLTTQLNKSDLEKGELQLAKDQLQQQLDGANLKLDNVKTQKDHMEKEVDSANAQIHAKEEALFKLSQSHEEAKTELAQLKKSMEEVTCEKSDLIERLNKALDEKKSLSKTVEEKKDVIEDQKHQLTSFASVQAELDSAKKDLASSHDEVKQLKEAIEIATKEKEKLVDSLAAKEIEHEQSLDELENLLRSKSDEAEAVRSQIATLEESEEKAKAELLEVKTETAKIAEKENYLSGEIEK